MTRFTFFVPSTAHFIWLSSWIVLCQQQYDRICAVCTTGVAKAPGIVSIQSPSSLWCTKDLEKQRLILPWIFVEFTNKQKRSLTTKPRGGKHPKVAKRGGNGNAIRMMDTIMTQTYYCDVSKWRMARSACWMLLWPFQMAQIWTRHTGNLFSRFLALETCTSYPGNT